MTYVFSLPFLIIGIIYGFKIKNNYGYIFKFWFISSFLLFFVLNYVNINRINIFIFPMIYFTIEGIYCVIENSKPALIVIASVYAVLFVVFEIKYFSLEENGRVFVNDIKEVIGYVDNLEAEEIYFEYDFKEPYIYVLYYTEYNPNEFNSTKKYFDNEYIGSFDNIKGFGKYNFYIPESLDDTKKTVYIINKNNLDNLDYSNFQIKEFNKHIVLYNE